MENNILTRILSQLYKLFFTSKEKNDKDPIIKKMEETEEKYEKKIKEENNNFEKEKQKITKAKKETIKIIENNKKSTIEENNKKHKNLLSYLESIKDDKKQLIEFFQNTTIF